LGILERFGNALALAQHLESHSSVERVYYPGLESHPQHGLVGVQQSTGGAIVSIDVKGGKDAAWQLIDNTELLSITANLGDTRTIITQILSKTCGLLSF